MDLSWTVQRSRLFIFSIALLSTLPTLVSVLINQSIVQMMVVLIFSVVVFYFLYQLTTIISINDDNHLSWSNGHWYFSNKHIFIEGKKNKDSFTLGLLTFLVIENESKQRVKLWLIPNNITKHQSCGWRELQACYHLSKHPHQQSPSG